MTDLRGQPRRAAGAASRYLEPRRGRAPVRAGSTAADPADVHRLSDADTGRLTDCQPCSTAGASPRSVGAARPVRGGSPGGAPRPARRRPASRLRGAGTRRPRRPGRAGFWDAMAGRSLAACGLPRPVARATTSDLLRGVRGCPPSRGIEALAARAGRRPAKSVLFTAYYRLVRALAGRTRRGRGSSPTAARSGPGGGQARALPQHHAVAGGARPPTSWTELPRDVFAAERDVIAHRRFPLAEMQRGAGRGEALVDTAFNLRHFHGLERHKELERPGGAGLMATDQTYFAWTAYFNVDTAGPISRSPWTATAWAGTR